ncbi:MAG: 2,3-bisphosphoglycerate-dependent phosphoglycerate mutase [Candidatus Kapaibacterium sp.]
MPILTLVRHGESVWNLENRFTGWVDVDLSARGEEEARSAGAMLRAVPVDVLFTSVLKRAIRTADLMCSAAGITPSRVIRDEALNERHYGDLQGLNKDDIGREYGMEQLKIWRRSYDVPPPNGESLKMTQERVLPYYREHIEPMLRAGSNVLVVAHGNSLRALVMHIEGMTPEQILETNIPTATPFWYELDADMQLVAKHHTPW